MADSSRINSRLLLNLGLLGLLAILVLLVAYEPGLEKPAEPVKLTVLDAAAIRQVRIERPAQPELVLERHGTRWRITAPQRLDANDFYVDSLLRIASAMSRAQYPKTTLDLARLGLAPPKLRLRLDDLAIAFGDTEPLHNHRYVLIGDVVHLTTDSHYYRLIGELPSFVSTALLPNDAKIAEILLPDDTALRLAQTGWTITPKRSDVSADAFTRLADEWRLARALQVKRHQPGADHGRIRLRLASGETLDYLVMAETPELVLARPATGMQYHLPADAAARLLRLAAPRDASAPAAPDKERAHTPPAMDANKKDRND